MGGAGGGDTRVIFIGMKSANPTILCFIAGNSNIENSAFDAPVSFAFLSKRVVADGICF